MTGKSTFIVAIDQGKTSSRAMIFDAHGRAVSSAQREFEQIFPRSGWVEHRPRDILTSVQVTLTEAMHNAGIEASAIAGIGITNQRETTVVWDRNTGEPVYNALRSEEHTSELQSLMRISYAVFCLKTKKKQYTTNTKHNIANNTNIT